jgi:hypothetical protein
MGKQRWEESGKRTSQQKEGQTRERTRRKKMQACEKVKKSRITFANVSWLQKVEE